jgi:hypothetical protein
VRLSKKDNGVKKGPYHKAQCVLAKRMGFAEKEEKITQEPSIDTSSCSPSPWRPITYAPSLLSSLQRRRSLMNQLSQASRRSPCRKIRSKALSQSFRNSEVVVVVSVLMNSDLCVASWNLRGLNNLARRSSICLFLSSFNLSLVCAQETKLQFVDSPVIWQTFGPAFDRFDYIPANGTRGGIILAWRSDVLQVRTKHKGEFSITAEVTSKKDAKTWMITSVYGPQESRV